MTEVTDVMCLSCGAWMEQLSGSFDYDAEWSCQVHKCKKCGGHVLLWRKRFGDKEASECPGHGD